MPVRDSLRPGSNTLSITIQPAIPEAESRAKASPYVVPSVQVRSAGIWVCLVCAIVNAPETCDVCTSAGARHGCKLQLASEACLRRWLGLVRMLLSVWVLRMSHAHATRRTLHMCRCSCCAGAHASHRLGFLAVSN